MADVIRIGDRVTDCNPTRVRYNQSGTVVSVRGDKITWRSDKDGQLVTDARSELKKEMSRTISNRQQTQQPVQNGTDNRQQLHGGNKYYVKYSTRLSIQQLNQKKSEHNLISIKHATKHPGLITSADNVVIVESNNINQIKQDPNVVLVEEEPKFEYYDEFNDPIYFGGDISQQYLEDQANHYLAIQEFGFGNFNPNVGLKDNGVLISHPDLQGKVIDTTGGGVNIEDNDHGTPVASIISTNTNNEWGMAGTCPNCSIYYFNNMLEACYDGPANGVRAINVSSGYFDSNQSTILQDAINEAYEEGTMFIVAAGNRGYDINDPSKFHMYCDYTNVLCVAAWNNFNHDSSCTVNNVAGTCNVIDVSAPIGIVAACEHSMDCNNKMDGYGNPTNGVGQFRRFSGTSSSAPIVTGLAGLLLSHHPTLSSQDIYNIITSTNINPSEGNRPGSIDFHAALTYLYENYIWESGGYQVGDINQDQNIDILDVIALVNWVIYGSEGVCQGHCHVMTLLEGESEQPCGPECGCQVYVESNEWIVLANHCSIEGGLTPQQIALGDMNGDGLVNTLDVILLLNSILDNPQTTSSEQQELQRQLDRLNGVDGRQQTQRQSDGHHIQCPSGQIWGGSECMPAVQPPPTSDDYDVLQDIIDINNLPQTLEEFLDYNSAYLLWNGDRLTSLDLSCQLNRCYLNDMGAEIHYLPDSLGNLSELTYIGMNGTGLKTLPSSLGNLVNLIELVLYGCELGSSHQGILPDDCFQNLINLEKLYIHDNPNLRYLPTSVCNCSSLQELYSYGPGSGWYPPYTGGLQELPSCLPQLTNLWKLHVHGNSFYTIPFDICSMTSLQEVYMNDNNLVGELPECIVGMGFEYGNFQISRNMLWCDYSNPETGCEQGCAPQWYCDYSSPNGPFLPVGSGCSSGGYTNQRCDDRSSDGRGVSPSPVPISRTPSRTRQTFRENYLLTFNESNRIKKDNSIPLDLRNIAGYMHCLGKDNGYPCYWIPENSVESIEDIRDTLSSIRKTKIFDTSKRNLKYTISPNSATYSFDVSKIEQKYNVTLSSDYVILAECGESEIAGFREVYQDDIKITSVQVMGVDARPETQKYCKSGQIPNFYVYNTKTKQEFKLDGNISQPFYTNVNYIFIL